MNIYRDQIIVTRGETVTLDMSIVNSDGSPYIFSNKITNPFILVTIASSRYEQYGRYIQNYWSNVSARYPTFFTTTPVQIADFDSTPEESLPIDVVNQINNNDELTYSNYCVYYSIVNGKKVYKYWDDEWLDYECEFTMTIGPEDTLQWVEQEYVFAMKVLGGTLVDNPAPGARPLVNYTFMQKINAPSRLLVYSNISGSMEDII